VLAPQPLTRRAEIRRAEARSAIKRHNQFDVLHRIIRRGLTNAPAGTEAIQVWKPAVDSGRWLCLLPRHSNRVTRCSPTFRLFPV